MKYRLYTQDMKNGIMNKQDGFYHILDSKTVFDSTIALIYDERQFIVASGLELHVNYGIDWGHGHYFELLTDALEKYSSYSEQPEMKNFTAAVFWQGIGNEIIDITAKDYDDALAKLVDYYAKKGEILGTYDNDYFENHEEWDLIIEEKADITAI